MKKNILFKMISGALAVVIFAGALLASQVTETLGDAYSDKNLNYRLPGYTVEQATTYLDERNGYNGECVLSVSNKANLLTNIMKNNQKLTILEIVPYELASVFQINAQPENFKNYFDNYFKGKNISEIKEFMKDYVNSGKVSHSIEYYTDSSKKTEISFPKYFGQEWGYTIENGKLKNGYNSYVSQYYIVETYTFANQDTGFSDQWHPVSFSFVNDNGNETYNGAQVDNWFLDNYLGELDESNPYYRYRLYFENNIEVITVCASEIKEGDFIRKDPVDMVYIGGQISDGQIGMNLLWYMKNSYDVKNWNDFSNKNSDITNKDGSKFTFSNLYSNCWYDTYRNGSVNDMKWSMVEKLIDYIYGATSNYNTNSTIKYSDGSLDYQNIPVLIEEGTMQSHKDYNMYKLIFLLNRMSNEPYTLCNVMYNKCYISEYLDPASNKNNTGSLPSSYKAYSSDKTYFIKVSSDGTQLDKIKIGDDGKYGSYYDAQLSIAGDYQGFIKTYLLEPTDTSERTSAGLKTATDLNGNATWAGNMLGYLPTDDTGFIVMNTVIRYKQAGSSDRILYNLYNNNDEKGVADKGMSPQNTYEKRDMYNANGKIKAMDAFRYLIGLDPSDLYEAPDTEFVDSDSLDVEEIKAKNTFIVNYDYSTIDTVSADIKLDANGNMIVNYRISDVNNKTKKAVLYYTDTNDTTVSLTLEMSLSKFADPTLPTTLLEAYDMSYTNDALTSVKKTAANSDAAIAFKSSYSDANIKDTVYTAKTNLYDDTPAVYNFTCSIPKTLSNGDENPLYKDLLDGTKKLNFTAMSEPEFTNSKNEKKSKKLCDTATLRFVQRRVFDLD